MIPELHQTVEKPLTVIDYIAALEYCVDVTEVQVYSARCPETIRGDDRFAKAVARRLAAIKEKKAAA